MLEQISATQILCLDIETVPFYPTLHEVPEELRSMWLRKAANLKNEEGLNEEQFYKRAGIYAEFGKIICISTGFLSVKDGIRQFRLRSFSGDTEAVVLGEFAALLEHIHAGKKTPPMLLCGHNAKEFDFPYLCRRMIVNSIPLPPQLDIAGKKPWDIPHLDTMELWKFGDYKNYTPLNLLAHILGIPSPKDDIDGSQVGDVYWRERNLPRIVTYCQKDVLTVMQIILRLKGQELLQAEEIIEVS